MNGKPFSGALALALCLATMTVSADGIEVDRSVAGFVRRAEAGERLNIVWFGGSLTWGANASDPNRTSLRALVSKRLEEAYPKAHFRFKDAAIGGAGSTMEIFRVERDVLSERPDLVFFDCLVNDGETGGGDLADAAEEAILRRLLSESKAVVVPIMIPWSKTIETTDEASLRRWHRQKELCRRYSLASADILGECRRRFAARKLDMKAIWPADFPDSLHPYDPGYRLYADILWEQVFARPSSAVSSSALPPWLGKSTYAFVKRQPIASAAVLPTGWRKTLPWLRAGSFDFSCSRWMDSMCAAANCIRTGWDAFEPNGVSPAPLKGRFRGEVFGLMGESMPHCGAFRLVVDGKEVFKSYATDKMGKNFPPSAYLFTWPKGGFDPSVWHDFEIIPLFGAKDAPSELRLESVCVAGSEAAAVVFTAGDFDRDFTTGTAGKVENREEGIGKREEVAAAVAQGDMQAAVQKILDDAVASGAQSACQCCVYIDGKLVVDTWAGTMATNSAEKIDGSTLFPIFSTEKAQFVTAAHIAHERGKFDYEAKIRDYWPEFKGGNKDELTVRQLLGMRTGLPGSAPREFTDAQQCDWKFMTDWAAKSETKHPGQSGYLGITWGWYLGKVIENAYGRPLNDVLTDEVLKPCGIEKDYYFAVPDSELKRVVTVYNGRENYGFEQMNKDCYRKACVPSAYAVANARAIAEFYLRLSGQDGKPPLIRRETLMNALKVNRADDDPLPDAETLRKNWQTVWGLGYTMWGERDELDRITGSGGLGGSEGFCDLKNRISIGYTCAVSATATGKPWDIRPDIYKAVGIRTRYVK